MDTDRDDLLTLGEAVAVLDGLGLPVTGKTVRRWSDAGKLAAIRTPGGQRRFRRSDIEALLPSTPTEPEPAK